VQEFGLVAKDAHVAFSQHLIDLVAVLYPVNGIQ
jgi:hypothetical protein